MRLFGTPGDGLSNLRAWVLTAPFDKELSAPVVVIPVRKVTGYGRVDSKPTTYGKVDSRPMVYGK